MRIARARLPLPSRKWIRPAAPFAGNASELIPILLVVLCAIVRLRGTVEADVGWQLWVAGRIMDERISTGILWRSIRHCGFGWESQSVSSRNLVGARPDAVLIAAIAVTTIASLIATARLTANIGIWKRTFFLVYAAAILFLMPWVHIGQREQLVLIGALPYGALIAARRNARDVSLRLAVAVGTGAAIGFALKHYFLIVPAVLELWLYRADRRSWSAFRPELVTMVTVGIAYTVAMLLYARDYFTIALPLIRLAYGATGAVQLIQTLQPAALIALLIVFFIIGHSRKHVLQRSPLGTALLISAIGFGAAYFIQHKGWLYHSIPFLGCASLALAALIIELEEPM